MSYFRIRGRSKHVKRFWWQKKKRINSALKTKNIFKLKIFRFDDSLRSCNLIDISKIVSRAKIIAEFVISQMSEDVQPDDCINQCTNKHLKLIKEHIKRNVIPLGKIKIGSHFERALLFKVLADRVLLPAALVRDQYCKAWIEISVPQVKINLTL